MEDDACYSAGHLSDEKEETNEDVNAKKDENHLGKRIGVLRSILGMSKTDFATFIHASRSTVDRIEKTGEVTQEIAYKIFYATTKAMERPYISDMMMKFAKDLRADIEKEILFSDRNRIIEELITTSKS